MNSAPLQHADALARDLASAGFTSGGVRALVGDDAADALARMSAAPARRAALAHPGRRSTLVRALVLGDRVPSADLAAALPEAGLEGAVALGVVALEDDEAVPLLAVRPVTMRDALGESAWVVASDLDELSGARPLRPDHVLGVGGAARTLVQLLPPVAAGTALDLGTGCGIVALHLRRFAERVVATDVSPRALELAALNAALNGVDGIELRLGSLYEPVVGERFDLVASNPPFVITPRAAGVPAYEYRDGGLEGDRLMEAAVGGVAAHLTPGGTARMLGNWETRGGAAGRDRALGWAGAGLDAWVLEREALSPVAYAELWLRDGGTRPGDDGHDALLGAWLDDLEARAVDEVGMGWVVLHDGGTGLARAERVPQGVALERAGAHLAEALEAEAWLAARDDDALLGARLLAAPDVTEARHQVPGAAGPTVIELRQGGGLGRSLSVDAALAGLVGASDGELPVGVLLGAIAGLLEVDEAPLVADLLPRVRELVRIGMLTPA